MQKYVQFIYIFKKDVHHRRSENASEENVKFLCCFFQEKFSKLKQRAI